MTVEQTNPYSITLQGTVNGEPHSVQFDAKEILADQSEMRGETISDEQLSADALQLVSDTTRVQEAFQGAEAKPTRLQRIAAKVGSFIRS